MRAFEAFVGSGVSLPGRQGFAGAARQLQILCVHDITSARDDRRITTGLQDFAGQTGEHSLFVSLACCFPARHGCPSAAVRGGAVAAPERDPRDRSRRPRLGRERQRRSGFGEFQHERRWQGVLRGGAASGRQPAARRFRCPVLVFNPHQPVRAAACGWTLREVAPGDRPARHRVHRLANPMLAVHGKSPEARQYSGRQVGADWVCPFHATGEDGRR